MDNNQDEKTENNPISNSLVDLLDLLSRAKQPITAEPTNVPRNFYEMIEPFDDGDIQGIYFYIDDEWVLLTSGLTNDFTASDNLKSSADTEQTSSSASYAKIKEFKVKFDGDLRIKYDSKTDDVNVGDVKIYLNGVAETSAQRVTTSYVTYSNDITVEKNDLVQIYVAVGSNDIYVKNARIYYDKTPVNDCSVILD